MMDNPRKYWMLLVLWAVGVTIGWYSLSSDQSSATVRHVTQSYTGDSDSELEREVLAESTRGDDSLDDEEPTSDGGGDDDLESRVDDDDTNNDDEYAVDDGETDDDGETSDCGYDTGDRDDDTGDEENIDDTDGEDNNDDNNDDDIDMEDENVDEADSEADEETTTPSLRDIERRKNQIKMPTGPSQGYQPSVTKPYNSHGLAADVPRPRVPPESADVMEKRRAELAKLKAEAVPTANSSMITILLWIDPERSGDVNWNGFNQFGQEPFIKRGCKHTNCDVTYDRSRIAEADFIIVKHEMEEWPAVQYPWHSYIHIIRERPGGPWDNFIIQNDHRINITMQYRHDADIRFNNNGFHILNDYHKAEGPYKVKYPLSSKPKSIAWMVSHCGADSKRDDYAAELAKYIDIDVYGDCGPHKSCPKLHGAEGWANNFRCFEEFSQNYKFYLGFENSFCRDYLTEKVYRPLGYELVPIVLGSANYTRDTPPHSVINIRDFNSPKELAEYLKYLMANEDKYYEYFQWKTSYGMISLQDQYCTLCDALNDPGIATKQAGGLWDWWASGCDNTVIGSLRQKQGW